jgi:tetratricopeptide (TPR) repeat protein
LAKSRRKKSRIAIKDMKYRNDPMIRFYERTQDWLQDKGRPIIIAIGVVVGLLLIYTAGSYFFHYRKARAEAAFAQAFEKYNAPVQDGSVVTTAPPTGRTYGDEATKWQESAEAFEQLANDYSGYYGTIGRYYAGVAYLHLEGNRDRGLSLLDQAAGKNDQPTSDLARLAMVENYAANGEAEKAISICEQLVKSDNVFKPAVQLALGRLYEKSGNTEKAVEAYFEAAKPDRSVGAGQEAEKRLAAIAPDRVKELPAATNAPFQP